MVQRDAESWKGKLLVFLFFYEYYCCDKTQRLITVMLVGILRSMLIWLLLVMRG